MRCPLDKTRPWIFSPYITVAIYKMSHKSCSFSFTCILSLEHAFNFGSTFHNLATTILLKKTEVLESWRLTRSHLQCMWPVASCPTTMSQCCYSLSGILLGGWHQEVMTGQCFTVPCHLSVHIEWSQ